jgi:hypothetical protein
MKNLRNILIVLSLLMFLTLGCGGLVERLSKSGSGANASSTPEATGIPECDQLFTKIEEKVSDKNKETTFIERTAYNLIKDQIQKTIRQNVANSNAADKRDIGRKCTEAMEKMEDEPEPTPSSSNKK